MRAWGGSERGTKRGQAVKLKSWYHSQKPSRLQPTSPSSPVTDLDSVKKKKKITRPSSPDRVPHIEAVQRLRACGVSSCQANKCRQPVGDVDELTVHGTRLFQ